MISRRACIAGGLSAGLSTALVGGCGSPDSGSSGDRVTLDFFQFKPEAVESFAGIIKKFEAEYPHIHVAQDNTPNPQSAIRTRLVRNDVPDVITLNGDSIFGELAEAGVFHDFSGEAVAATVTPAIQKVLDALGTKAPDESNGLPFASNADAVIYNKALFAKYDVAVPTTWGAFIAAAKTFRKAGVTPFYGALKDAWTGMPAFNALASNFQPPLTFFPRRLAGRTTFTKAYAEAADRLAELYDYTQKDTLSRGYDAGNQAFAEGESAMYLQGIWAIPAVKTFKPAFDIGTFAYPVADEPSANRLVSGVDVAVTMGRSTKHPKESMTFINYLMRPEVVKDYATEQMAFPTLTGSSAEEPALAGLLPYFDSGRLVGFSDHFIPVTLNINAISQQFLIDGRRDAFLGTLDREWDKYQARQS